MLLPGETFAACQNHIEDGWAVSIELQRYRPAAVELVNRKLWQDQTGLPLSRLPDRVGYPGSPTDQHFASIHADGNQRIHSALLGNGDTQIAVQLPA